MECWDLRKTGDEVIDKKLLQNFSRYLLGVFKDCLRPVKCFLCTISFH